MNDLDETYKRLARDWPSEELATRYASARDQGARSIKNPRPAVARAHDRGIAEAVARLQSCRGMDAIVRDMRGFGASPTQGLTRAYAAEAAAWAAALGFFDPVLLG